MSLSLAARRARLLALRDAIDAGGAGAVQFCDGTPATTPEASPGAAVIATVPLAAVSFELDATEALMTLVPATGYASRMGTPTWARIVDGTGAAVLDAPAGPPGSGAAFVITNGDTPPSAQLYTGGQVTITAQITEP